MTIRTTGVDQASGQNKDVSINETILLNSIAGGVTGGAGNAIVITGNNATSGNNAGGSVTITSGDGLGSGNGAAINITTGAGGNSAGNGGTLSLTTGNGAPFGSNGNGGALSITSGQGVTGGDGGAISIVAGHGNNAGSVTISGGVGGFSGSGSGGQVSISGGNGNAAGGVLSLSGGSTVAADTNGGSVNISAGNPRGTGFSNIRVFSGLSLASGSTAQSQCERLLISGKRTNLTNNVDSQVLQFIVDTNKILGAQFFYTVRSQDATDFQVETGSFFVTGVNKAGTISQNMSSILGPSRTTSTGTISCTFTLTNNASTYVNIFANVNSSLTPTILDIAYQVYTNSEVSVVQI